MTSSHNSDPPKVFISYSWSSTTHRDLIRGYADRLIGDGVEVILDQYDLLEGQDKFHFMEKMVTDSTVTHVLVFSDHQYAEKANNRNAGVGTESQIMSKDIYERVDQTKFIPIFCELNEQYEPSLPHFLKTRIALNFTTPEKVNENWERLIRLLHGKPEFQKPRLGLPPSYLSSTTAAIESSGKLISLKSSAYSERPTKAPRRDFLEAIFKDIESTKLTKGTDDDESVLILLHNLLPIRDSFLDWIILEIDTQEDDGKLATLVQDFFERLISTKSQHPHPSQVNPWWPDAIKVFIYEIFLYLVALLIKNTRDEALINILSQRYFIEGESSKFITYEAFYGYSQALASRNDRLNLNRLSLVADELKSRATRGDIPFRSIMESEAIILANTVINTNSRWFPLTLVYAEYLGAFAIFLRASEKKGLDRLLKLFRKSNVDDLKKSLEDGIEHHQLERTRHFIYIDFRRLYAIEQWGTLS